MAKKALSYLKIGQKWPKLINLTNVALFRLPLLSSAASPATNNWALLRPLPLSRPLETLARCRSHCSRRYQSRRYHCHSRRRFCCHHCCCHSCCHRNRCHCRELSLRRPPLSILPKASGDEGVKEPPPRHPGSANTPSPLPCSLASVSTTPIPLSPLPLHALVPSPSCHCVSVNGPSSSSPRLSARHLPTPPTSQSDCSCATPGRLRPRAVASPRPHL